MHLSKLALRVLIVVGVIAILLVVLALFGLTQIDGLISRRVAEKAVIYPGTLMHTSWTVPSVPVYLSVYVYNVTNPVAVTNGKQPVLKEIGPFVYRQKREKLNISWWWSNGTKWNGNILQPPEEVTYRPKVTYLFEPNMSFADPNEVVVNMINPVWATLATAVTGHFKMFAVQMLVNTAGDWGVFTNNTVHRLLWGYNDTFLLAKAGLASNTKTEVGFLINKNTTLQPEVRMATGVGNISRLGRILSYANMTKLPYWSSDTANMINGTDGTISPPGLKRHQDLDFFAPDLCRSFRSSYTRAGPATNRDDIELYSFSTSSYEMANSTVNPMNAGFCPEHGCAPSGLIDLSVCRKSDKNDVPVFASLPHFLNAAPSVKSKFDGIPPADPANDKTILRMEPITGFLLEAYKRLQINFFVGKSLLQESYYPNLAIPYYFPALWFKETVVADKPVLDRLHRLVLRKRELMRYTLYGIIAFSLAYIICALCIICAMRYLYNRSNSYTPASVLKTDQSSKLEANAEGAKKTGKGADKKSKKNDKTVKKIDESQSEVDDKKQPDVAIKMAALNGNENNTEAPAGTGLWERSVTG